ncbi:neprilysin-2 isoform X2 [Planococcus citri]|uniref:neprilysin-2 isoform X2 n=1 Tax=Planococcus citri TaxID=170843 RepID=UPI0031F8684C
MPIRQTSATCIYWLRDNIHIVSPTSSNGFDRLNRNPSWWRRRTTLEKNLTILSFLVVVLMMISVGILVYTSVQKNDEELPSLSSQNGLAGRPRQRNSFIQGSGKADGCKDMCTTPGCINAASAILKNMDTTVDPCDDFYQFACGKFLKETQVPEDKTSVTTFSVISDLLMDQLKMIITEPISDYDIKPYKLAKNLYKACMDRNKIEEVGLEPALKMLKRLGGWPVLEANWDEGSFTWRDSVYKFRKEGFSVDYFIDFSVATDLKNTTVRIIDIDQASLGLSREYLVKGLDEKIVAAYYKYMVDIAVLFGADRNRATKELRESLDFEIQLANISLPLEERRNATKLYNPMNITYIQRQFPSIPWLEYINTILAPTNKISESEVVIINTPQYLHNLETLLSKTPKRIQANYVMWRAAASSVSYLTESVRKRQLDYSTELSGRTEREPRWKECVDNAAGSFALAIGSLYVRRFFKDDAKKNALDMVEGIRKEMYKILSTVDWMDESTRKNALDKARSMVNHIAYPDELLEEKKLIEFYEKLEIDPNEYYMSLLNLTKFGTDYSFSKLREPVNKTDWITHSRPAVVNAFYNSLENSIQFPAGILQHAFFSNDRPKYLNYGAIGFVIGHEITHGFDDQGRQFDKNGNLVDWWDPNTKERYLEKAKCIIDQYGNYTAEEVNLKLNGVNTQGENIADNGGVKEAYLAYIAWSKKNGVEPKLPGLQDYSPQQMFWISAANVWCSKYRPESLKLRITTGFHSPGRFRVIGPLSNQEEFARDFRCPSGSKMNPTKKCKVW